MGGGKYLTKYVIANKFKPYLDLWLKQRKELGIESDWLFVTNYGSKEYKQALSGTLNSWALTNTKILGVDFYWHCLRHFFVSDMLRQSLPDSVVVDIVGWSDATQLPVYNDNPIDDKFAKYFDENGIKTVEKKELSDL